MNDTNDIQMLTGHQAVLEALKHRRRALYRLWISRKSGTEDLVQLAGSIGLRIKEVQPAKLSNLVGHGKHQGVVLECGPLPVYSLEEIMRFEPPDGRDLLLFPVGVEDPRNLGAIARCGSFLGARAMLIPGRGSSPLSPAASRTSSGALENLPVAVVPGASNVCQRLGSNGYEVIGIELDGIPLWKWKAEKNKVVLVLGGEDRGLGKSVRNSCDGIVCIPGTGMVNSLNVSVAAGIALFHVMEQWRKSDAETREEGEGVSGR